MQQRKCARQSKKAKEREKRTPVRVLERRRGTNEERATTTDEERATTADEERATTAAYGGRAATTNPYSACATQD
jgi:hypothetical protein